MSQSRIEPKTLKQSLEELFVKNRIVIDDTGVMTLPVPLTGAVRMSDNLTGNPNDPDPMQVILLGNNTCNVLGDLNSYFGGQAPFNSRFEQFIRDLRALQTTFLNKAEKAELARLVTYIGIIEEFKTKADALHNTYSANHFGSGDVTRQNHFAALNQSYQNAHQEFFACKAEITLPSADPHRDVSWPNSVVLNKPDAAQDEKFLHSASTTGVSEKINNLIAKAVNDNKACIDPKSLVKKTLEQFSTNKRFPEFIEKIKSIKSDSNDQLIDIKNSDVTKEIERFARDLYAQMNKNFPTLSLSLPKEALTLNFYPDNASGNKLTVVDRFISYLDPDVTCEQLEKKNFLPENINDMWIEAFTVGEDYVLWIEKEILIESFSTLCFYLMTLFNGDIKREGGPDNFRAFIPQAFLYVVYLYWKARDVNQAKAFLEQCLSKQGSTDLIDALCSGSDTEFMRLAGLDAFTYKHLLAIGRSIIKCHILAPHLDELKTFCTRSTITGKIRTVVIENVLHYCIEPISGPIYLSEIDKKHIVTDNKYIATDQQYITWIKKNFNKHYDTGFKRSHEVRSELQDIKDSIANNNDHYKVYIESGPELLTTCDEYGRSPLLIALMSGSSPETVEYLATKLKEHYSDEVHHPINAPGYPYHDKSLLNYAIATDSDKLKILIKIFGLGDNTFTQDLLQGAQEGNLFKVQRVLDAFPSFVQMMDANRMTALHHAAAKGHLDIVKYLIGKAANPMAKAGSQSPMDLALENGHIETYCYLFTQSMVPVVDTPIIKEEQDLSQYSSLKSFLVTLSKEQLPVYELNASEIHQQFSTKEDYEKELSEAFADAITELNKRNRLPLLANIAVEALKQEKIQRSLIESVLGLLQDSNLDNDNSAAIEILANQLFAGKKEEIKKVALNQSELNGYQTFYSFLVSVDHQDLPSHIMNKRELYEFFFNKKLISADTLISDLFNLVDYKNDHPAISLLIEMIRDCSSRNELKLDFESVLILLPTELSNKLKNSCILSKPIEENGVGTKEELDLRSIREEQIKLSEFLANYNNRLPFCFLYKSALFDIFIEKHQDVAVFLNEILTYAKDEKSLSSKNKTDYQASLKFAVELVTYGRQQNKAAFSDANIARYLTKYIRNDNPNNPDFTDFTIKLFETFDCISSPSLPNHVDQWLKPFKIEDKFWNEIPDCVWLKNAFSIQDKFAFGSNQVWYHLVAPKATANKDFIICAYLRMMESCEQSEVNVTDEVIKTADFLFNIIAEFYQNGLLDDDTIIKIWYSLSNKDLDSPLIPPNAQKLLKVLYSKTTTLLQQPVRCSDLTPGKPEMEVVEKEIEMTRSFKKNEINEKARAQEFIVAQTQRIKDLQFSFDDIESENGMRKVTNEIVSLVNNSLMKWAFSTLGQEAEIELITNLLGALENKKQEISHLKSNFEHQKRMNQAEVAFSSIIATIDAMEIKFHFSENELIDAYVTVLINQIDDWVREFSTEEMLSLLDQEQKEVLAYIVESKKAEVRYLSGIRKTHIQQPGFNSADDENVEHVSEPVANNEEQQNDGELTQSMLQELVQMREMEQQNNEERSFNLDDAFPEYPVDPSNDENLEFENRHNASMRSSVQHINGQQNLEDPSEEGDMSLIRAQIAALDENIEKHQDLLGDDSVEEQPNKQMRPVESYLNLRNFRHVNNEDQKVPVSFLHDGGSQQSTTANVNNNPQPGRDNIVRNYVYGVERPQNITRPQVIISPVSQIPVIHSRNSYVETLYRRCDNEQLSRQQQPVSGLSSVPQNRQSGGSNLAHQVLANPPSSLINEQRETEEHIRRPAIEERPINNRGNGERLNEGRQQPQGRLVSPTAGYQPPVQLSFFQPEPPQGGRSSPMKMVFGAVLIVAGLGCGAAMVALNPVAWMAVVGAVIAVALVLLGTYLLWSGNQPEDVVPPSQEFTFAG